MAATRNDMNTLSTDPVFQNRVRASIIAAAVAIANEGWAVAFHRERQRQAALILNGPDTYKTLFANSVATDTTVIADATVGGTVALTSNNVATQAALVTDAHIDTAVSAQFNTYIVAPAS